jgi:DNA mismatch endonuclease (patch repair protein)
MPDIMSKEKRSEIMSKIKGTDTKIELSIRKKLWARGYRGFRKHYKIKGKPDIVFPKKRIAIFCDGTFWHGKNFKKWKRKLTPFWLKKISDNIKRDHDNRKTLRSDGWTVLSFWEDDIEKRLDECANKIINAVKNSSAEGERQNAT